MDQNQHGQNQNATRRGTSTTPTQTHAINQYQSNHMMPPPPLNQYPLTQVFAGPCAAAPSPYLRSDQQQYDQHHYMQQLQQQQKLNSFWESRYQEIEQTTDFRNQCLPLARIKKIMKSDEDVKKISAEAPVVFAKACEMFMMELTLRAWANAEENKRSLLQKNYIAAAVTKTEVFDFLVDVVPRDEIMDLDLYYGIRRSRGNSGANNNNIGVGPYENNVPYYYYYYMPPQHLVGPPYMPHQQHVVGPPHPFVAQVGPRKDHSCYVTLRPYFH